MNTSRQKLPVTPEMIDKYFLKYLESHPRAVLLSSHWTNSFKEGEVLRITLTMHIFNVPAEDVNYNSARYVAFLDAIVPHDSDLRERCVEAGIDSMVTLVGKTSIKINVLITFWNENPEVFKSV